jgi:hypothetical protein
MIYYSYTPNITFIWTFSLRSHAQLSVNSPLAQPAPHTRMARLAQTVSGGGWRVSWLKADAGEGRRGRRRRLLD